MKENYYNCIYMYINKINGKKYVGQASDFNKRYKQHINSSNNKKQKHDYNVPFHNAIRKYGIENFEIKILAENISTQDKLNEYEIFFIKRYKTLNIQNGYNVSSGGSNGNPYAGKTEEEMMEVRKHMSDAWHNKTEEDKNIKREKCSKSAKERFQNKENHPMYGKIHTEESKKKMSENSKGRKAWNKGKRMSDEQKEKLRNSNLGKKLSEETKQKMSESHKGHDVWNKGKHLSEEHKQKISIRVVQYDENMNLIKIWDSAKIASESLGVDASSISRCYKGKQKKAGIKNGEKFYWKYYEEVE